MKRHRSSKTLVAGSVLLATACASVASAEMIVNGGFESGQLTAWTGSRGCTVETNPSLAHNGKFCAKLSGSSASLTQVVRGLNPNTTYTLVAYARLQKAGEYVFIGVRAFGGQPVTRVSVATSYAKVALKFVTGPKNTTATVFFSKDNGSGDALADDFSLLEGLNDVDVIDSWLFTQSCWNARDRRLLEVLRPDMLHRAGFYWVGTALLERHYEGARQSLARLRDAGSKNSRILGAGTSGLYWEPDIETLGPGVDKEKATETRAPRRREIDQYAGRGNLTRDAENQLIFKAKQQIDAGFFDIEFDELCPSEYVVSTLHDYAKSKYGRKVFIVANPINLRWGHVDYYMVRFFSFKDARGNFDGQVNPALPEKNCFIPGDKDLPYFWFVDFPGINWLAPDSEQYPDALRLIDAWTLAAGNHRPSWSRTFQNRSDPLVPGHINSGVFNIDANMVKFLKENSVLWHNLQALKPTTLEVDNAGKVWKTAYTQPMRTIVHLVNGNYDNQTHSMPRESGLTLRVSLDAKPTGIWLTTPDKLSTTRRQSLPYTFANGIATIAIPDLYFHDIVVIEQGPPNTTYNPVYEPMRVVFPFPIRPSLPVANTTHITAIQTEGYCSQCDWTVNGVPGGNKQLGTVTGDGDYTAPASPPKGGSVTIGAISRDDPKVSSSCELSILKPLPRKWSDDFADDQPGDLPGNWEIVDGQGDWEVATDGSGKVLHNSNLMDGLIEYRKETDFTGASGFNAMIVAGDQRWKDYTYHVDFKPVQPPAMWYSQRGQWRYGVFIIFRYQDHNNYYWYQLCSDRKVRLYKDIDGKKSMVNKAVTCPFPTPAPGNPGGYQRVEITVDGDTFTLQVDGKTVRTDTDSALPSGAIGLATSFTENCFKSISVAPPARR